MRTHKTTLTAVSASPWIPLDHDESHFAVGFGVVVGGTGGITYTVQHTFDNLFADASATAFDHSTASGKTASFDGFYTYPITGIRLRATAVSGVASATLAVVQAG